MVFKSVLDPDFNYRNAASTDIRLTFERIRREQEERSGNRKVKQAVSVPVAETRSKAPVKPSQPRAVASIRST